MKHKIEIKLENLWLEEYRYRIKSVKRFVSLGFGLFSGRIISQVFRFPRFFHISVDRINPRKMSGFTEEYTYAFAKHVKQNAGRRTDKQEYKMTRMEAKSIPFNCRTRPWSISKRVLRLSPRFHRADKEKNWTVRREQRKK